MADTKPLPDLYEVSIVELQDGLVKGLFTSVQLSKTYLARIDEVNIKAAALHAVLETNPNVVAQAAELDLERKRKGPRGPLHGIPVLIKDNIATLHSEGMNTTAGSFALLDSVVPDDAGVITRLRSSGALLLGKTQTSEWANYRGEVPSGFSGRGCQATCPYYPLVDPSGSSSGSAIAAAVGLAAGTLGTETDGSIVSPSSRNNVVGIKPTVGLTSRAGVIPISTHMDSVGPICRSVADCALILNCIAGPDPLDRTTLSQPFPVPDYLKALTTDALHGVRLGVPRIFMNNDPSTSEAFDAALQIIRGLGATIVDPADFPEPEEFWKAKKTEHLVMETDFKVEIGKYLGNLVEVPTGVRTLADIIKFNNDNADRELIPPYYADQSRFIAAENTSMNEDYFAAVRFNEDISRTRGIDATLQKFNIDALLLPTHGFAATPAGLAGYPIITVPLGFQPDDRSPDAAEPTRENGPGVPFGVAFIGTAWTEFQLLGFAFAYEQATHIRLKRLAYPEAIPKAQLEDFIGI